MEIRSIVGTEWMELWADSVSRHVSSIPSPVGTELPVFIVGALLPLVCFSHQVYHLPTSISLPSNLGGTLYF